MRFIADFHIHSKYSRATSKEMDLEELSKWAGIKGVQILGTGDFTHPAWFKNLKKKLKPAEPGLFSFGKGKTRFILTAEISCIYKKNNRVRKIHLIIFAPSLEVVEKINKKLSGLGNIKSDGRPILGLDAKELAKMVFDISSDCLVVPAHIWTPWFSIFGSKSGFNSISECFDDYSKYIFAAETGLSSDPAMNWQWSELDNIALISNSDCHSPRKIGREANVFDTEMSYGGIRGALKIKNNKKFLYTIEFYPEHGKYHLDGHKKCNISLSPAESKKYNNLCPVCKKPLVIGVLNRVKELADRPEGYIPQKAIPFKSLVPLDEIIAQAMGVSVISKKVLPEYNNLIKVGKNELQILLQTSYDELRSLTLPKIAEGIIRSREGKISIIPGFDGLYGRVNVFGNP